MSFDEQRTETSNNPKYLSNGTWRWGPFLIEHHIRRADKIGHLKTDEHTWLVIEELGDIEPECYQCPDRRDALAACIERRTARETMTL